MARIEQYGQVKLKGILFGDDNWGAVVDEDPPYKNKRGVEMKRFLIIPGEHLMKQYPELQKEGALPVPTPWGRAIWKEYPVYWVDDKNPSRTNALARIECGFDGRATLQTTKVKRFTDEIKRLQEELETSEISNLHVTEENRQFRTETKKLLKDLAEMSNITRSSGGFSEHKEEEKNEGH